MKKYIENYFKSRNKDKNDYILCELCNMDRIENIHHIENSYRGKRNDDPTKLIGVCYKCHQYIHNNNNNEMRENLLLIVKKKLNGK